MNTIDEQRILEFALQDIPEDGVYQSIGDESIYSLDWQAKYLWPKLESYGNLYIYCDNGYWFSYIEDDSTDEFRRVADSVIGVEDPATAVLLAVMELLKEKDNG